MYTVAKVERETQYIKIHMKITKYICIFTRGQNLVILSSSTCALVIFYYHMNFIDSVCISNFATMCIYKYTMDVRNFF